MKNETRYIDTEYAVNDRKVSGYAIVFNRQSKPLKCKNENRTIEFIETIDPLAVQGVLENSDIKFVLNHDISRGLLARSKYGKGSLSYSVDETGVKYEFEAPNTALGDELLEGIKRGDITSNSFEFRVAKNGDTWSKENNMLYRRINKFDFITDFSSVYNSAYEDAIIDTLDTRSLDEFEKTEKREQYDFEEIEVKKERIKQLHEEMLAEINRVTNIS